MPQPAVSAIDRKPGLGPTREGGESGIVCGEGKGRAREEERREGAFQGERAAKAEAERGVVWGGRV